MEAGELYLEQNCPPYSAPVTPPGLQAIYSTCKKLYPDQPNPLQVTAVVKYWLGGPDPLDYISMYAHPGNPDKGVCPHWHYVSLGLSDLHGDGRVHECTGPDGPSGFGFELTFRLKREAEESAPPTWPAALMQALARYVFQSENTLCVGDHIPWHSPLDGSESRIQHMLMTDDANIPPVTMQFGTVNFVQIVGVCAEELRAAQHWHGTGVLELLKTLTVAGGPWLITDMRRGETIFEIDPSLQEQVDCGIEMEGSNLSGVTSKCSWDESKTTATETSRCQSHSESTDEDKENRRGRSGQRRTSYEWERADISQLETDQIKAALKKGLNNTKPVLPPIKCELVSNQSSHANTDHNRNRSRKHSFDSTVSSDAPTELLRTRVLDVVHLQFNLEAGALLPLALKGRLKHGRHFTFKSVVNDVAITLVSSTVVGSFADEENPYAAHGPWLQVKIAECGCLEINSKQCVLWSQVLLPDDFIEDMSQDLQELEDPEEMLAPKTYSWPERKLSITILPDEL